MGISEESRFGNTPTVVSGVGDSKSWSSLSVRGIARCGTCGIVAVSASDGQIFSEFAMSFG